MATKLQIQKAIKASSKREDRERKLQDALGKQLAKAIAKEKGIVIGRHYYILSLNGGKRKFSAEAIAIDRYWREQEAGKEISVLVKFYNRNGAFKTEWLTTANNEFTAAPKVNAPSPTGT